MDLLYCESKLKQINEQMQKTEDQIRNYQGLLEQLGQQHIYLQGSLAIVNELIELYRAKEGCNNEES